MTFEKPWLIPSQPIHPLILLETGAAIWGLDVVMLAASGVTTPTGIFNTKGRTEMPGH